MAKSTKVELWTATSAVENARSALPALGVPRIQVSQLELRSVSKNLVQFVSDFQKTLQLPADEKSGFYIDEIELNLGITSSGGIALIGKLEAGMQAGMKIKLKRGQAPSS